MALSQQLLTQTGIKASPPDMSTVQGKRTVFPTRSCIGGQQVAHPEPTKAFLKQSPETAMLSAPFGRTHPPPPYPALSTEAEPISKGHCRK